MPLCRLRQPSSRLDCPENYHPITAGERNNLLKARKKDKQIINWVSVCKSLVFHWIKELKIMYRASLDVQDGHSVEPSETLDALVINTIFFSLRNST